MGIWRLAAFFCVFVSPSFAINFCIEQMSGANPARLFSQITLSDPKHVVEIDVERATAVAKILAEKKYKMAAPTWNFPPAYPGDEVDYNKVIPMLLVLDTINFRYFEGGAYYSEPGKLGAGLLAEKLTNSIDEISDPVFLKNLTAEQFSQIVEAQIPLPDIPARVRYLRELGAFLTRLQGKVDATNSSPRDVVKGIDWKEFLEQFDSPVDLAIFLSTSLSSFNDPFLKRSQLFVGMLIGRYGKEDWFPKKLKDTSRMTVYADYILPMVLHRMGILKYSTSLKRKISRERNIAAGSAAELEIRAATIVASDLLLGLLREHAFYKNITILDLDAALWLQSGELDIPGIEMPDDVFVMGEQKHHQTKTNHY